MKEEKDKIEGSGRNILKRVLAARLVIFAAAIVWVLGWLMLGIFFYPMLFDSQGLLLGYHGLPPTLVTFLSVWYIATFIVVGIWVSVKGFRFVGKWTRD